MNGLAPATGYGSKTSGLIAGATIDATIVPSGRKCIFDGILFHGDSDGARRTIDIQTAGGVSLALYSIAGNNQGSKRTGTHSNVDDKKSKDGIQSNDGLRIVKEAGVAGVVCNVLYRLSPNP